LPRDQPLGEPLEGADQEVLDRPEVVVDEAMVDSRLVRQPPCADAGVSDIHKQSLGRVEERVLRRRAGGGHDHVGAHAVFTVFRLSCQFPCAAISRVSKSDD
jgi:hypothetical protein